MRLSYRQREAPCRQGDISAVMDAVCGDVYFHYDMGSRSGKIARRLIGGYRRTVQTDGYEVYEAYELIASV